ncbi:MAG: hypothetical protein PUF37_05455 [Prevotellaceae bacterium]|nr:hypothetical protein [Prevotellaceae bacterium]
MITCIMDGKKGYPSTSEKIKITYENQFVKDSGSYTYDISFPMAITENRKLFGNIQRMDVKKNISDFESCRLYADNRLIMEGKGTVTAINNSTVKVQIVGGKSRIKYNSKFEKHYIDEINYPPVILDTGIKEDIYTQSGMEMPNMDDKPPFIFIDLSDANYVGQKGVAVLNPVNDETNEILANRIATTNFTKLKINGVKFKGVYTYMTNCAVQPYLSYILRKVMEYEGYSVVKNDLDRSPWNRLVIVSACKSGKVKDALPHWTVYKFIDELRKFFNASFVFDDVSKTVSISSTNEMLNNDCVSYECEDDFSVEYDEDGLDNISTSNVEYSFDGAANRDWREVISQSVQKNYVTKTYENTNALVTAAEKMSEKERKTTIFKVGFNYYVWADLPKDGNPENSETTEQRTQCGFFNPVIRDMNSDTFQDLNICPAAMYPRRNWDGKTTFWDKLGDKMGNAWIVVPSVENEKEQSLEDMEVDDDGEYYYSIQDAIQGSSEDTSSTSEDDDSKMPVAFQAENIVNVKKHQPVECNNRLDGEELEYRMPVLYTDYRMYPKRLLASESGSLSLESLSRREKGTFGQLRTDTSSRFSMTQIDGHHQITIKIITDEIPDPSKIFILRNKKYICEKIEVEVSNDGVSREKTGYFYEIIK